MTKRIKIQISFALSVLFLLSHSFAQGDAMFINSAGNVGIGTSTPKNKFSVDGSADFAENLYIKNSLIVDSESNNAGNLTKSNFNSLIRLGKESGEGIGSCRKDGNTNTYGLDFYTGFSLRMVISQKGNVGIGTSSPSSPLHIKTNGSQIMELETQEKDVYLRLTTNNNIGNWAIGTNEAGNGTDNNQFYIWNKHDIQNNKGNYAFTIQKQSGNVGIGTTSPTQGKLVVANSTSYSLGSFSYYAKGGITKSVYNSVIGASNEGVHFDGNFGNSNGNYVDISIYAAKRVAAEEFNAFSDSRIKKDFQKSDIAQDLETLRKIAITDYYYKDGLQHGFAQKKGIIAQEVEAVFPQAVNKHSDYISDIFAMPIHTNLEGNMLTVSMEKEHGLKNGDKVRLITPNEVAEVTIEVVDNKGFIVNNWDKKTSEVFVYGKLVDDFRSVDFDRLTILSISGVQQLCKEMEAMKAELQQTKDLFSKELAELKKDMQSLDAKVSNTKSNASR